MRSLRIKVRYFVLSVKRDVVVNMVFPGCKQTEVKKAQNFPVCIEIDCMKEVYRSGYCSNHWMQYCARIRKVR